MESETAFRLTSDRFEVFIRIFPESNTFTIAAKKLKTGRRFPPDIKPFRSVLQTIAYSAAILESYEVSKP